MVGLVDEFGDACLLQKSGQARDGCLIVALGIAHRGEHGLARVEFAAKNCLEPRVEVVLGKAIVGAEKRKVAAGAGLRAVLRIGSACPHAMGTPGSIDNVRKIVSPDLGCTRSRWLGHTNWHLDGGTIVT